MLYARVSTTYIYIYIYILYNYIIVILWPRGCNLIYPRGLEAPECVKLDNARACHNITGLLLSKEKRLNSRANRTTKSFLMFQR